MWTDVSLAFLCLSCLDLLRDPVVFQHLLPVTLHQGMGFKIITHNKGSSSRNIISLKPDLLQVQKKVSLNWKAILKCRVDLNSNEDQSFNLLSKCVVIRKEKKEKQESGDVFNSVEFSTTNVLKVFCTCSVCYIGQYPCVFFLNSIWTPEITFGTVTILYNDSKDNTTLVFLYQS